MPDVTVLLAAPDDGAAASATVRDLLQQSLHAIEILVLTGPAVVLDELPDDARIRVLPVTGESLGAVLNQGFASAQGGLIARAVAGDRSAPDRLERQAALLRTGVELSFVATGWREVGAEGQPGRVVTPPAGDAALCVAMAAGDVIGHPTAMMRHEAIVKAGGWRPAYVGFEDYDLLLRLMDRHPGACMPEPLVERPADDEAVPGWRDLEQRILSEMAAVAAYDRRQAGRPDHGEQSAPANRALLHRMGTANEEITRNVVARALDLAIATGSAGRWRAMREAARLGLEQEGLSGALKSRFVGLWLRSVARWRPLPLRQTAPIG